MHVAVNAQLLDFSPTYRSAGISRYIQHLLLNLAQTPTHHRLTAFVPGQTQAMQAWQGDSLRLQPTRWPTERPVGRILWEQLAQPAALTRMGADLLHCTGYVSPLLWRGRTVVTVCDLSFLRFPELFNRTNRLYLALFTRLSVRRAQRVIVISEHTRNEVIRLLNVAPERVTTTHCGVEARFHPLPPSEVAAYRAKRGLPEQYILYLGTLEPRKNVGTLLRAYARLLRTTNAPHKLVLAGAPGWQSRSAYQTVAELNIGAQVQFLGFVDSEEQALCYNGADLFVYPSLYEGFGLPVLEAMACGVPVISSNAASLPEVIGDAGIQVDPLHEEALAEAIARVLGNASLRSSLRCAGIERAKRFSWKVMALQTLQVYQEVLEADPPHAA